MHQKRQLEKNILSGIDRLVQQLIDLSCSQGRQKDQLLEEAVQTIKDIKPLLLILLGGREEHLESLLRQLISQKLPHGLALDSFGPFKRDLDTVLTMAFFAENQPKDEQGLAAGPPESAPENLSGTEAAAASEAAPAPEAEPAPPVIEQQPEQVFAAFLSKLFPSATLHQGYLYRSLYLHYYLPEKKLALLVLYPEVRLLPTIERLLQKEGVTLIKLQPSDLKHPALLARKLARYQ